MRSGKLIGVGGGGWSEEGALAGVGTWGREAWRFLSRGWGWAEKSEV